MSFFSTAKSLISITDFFISRWVNAKKKFREWNRRRVTKNIREAIDARSTSSISKQLFRIIKKRRKRRDSN